MKIRVQKKTILLISNVFETFCPVPILLVFSCPSEEVAGIPPYNEPSLIHFRILGLLAVFGSSPNFIEIHTARSRAKSRGVSQFPPACKRPGDKRWP